MNSRVSMILAGLLLIGALFAGYWGLVLSRPPEPVVDVASAFRGKTVAEAKTIPPIGMVLPMLCRRLRPHRRDLTLKTAHGNRPQPDQPRPAMPHP